MSGRHTLFSRSLSLFLFLLFLFLLFLFLLFLFLLFLLTTALSHTP